MRKEYAKPEVLVMLADADQLLAAVSQEPDEGTTTPEQNAKQHTWGSVWENEEQE